MSVKSSSKPSASKSLANRVEPTTPTAPLTLVPGLNQTSTSNSARVSCTHAGINGTDLNFSDESNSSIPPASEFSFAPTRTFKMSEIFVRAPDSASQLETIQHRVAASEWELSEVVDREIGHLAHSIATTELLHPITVTPDGSLVTGRRRLLACLLLGWTEMPVSIFTGNTVQAELASIDEDIEHKQLTALERCELLARRKHLCDALARADDEEPFTSSTAKVMNVTQRLVQQEVEIPTKICQEVRDAIRQTPLAGSKTELIRLKNLCKSLSPAEQAELVPHINTKTEKVGDIVTAKRWADNAARPVLSAADTDAIQVWHGDFSRESERIADESVDLILTDLPYPQEYLPLWSHLGEIAARVLKPGRFCISYSGQIYLPEVMNRLGKHLEFFWLAGLHHAGNKSPQYFQRHVLNAMKPILIYYKPPVPNPPLPGHPQWFKDLVSSGDADKRFHEWGQSIEPFEYLLEKFSKPGDLVFEPCSGGGTTPVACLRKGRRCIAIDNDSVAYQTTLHRLNQEHTALAASADLMSAQPLPLAA